MDHLGKLGIAYKEQVTLFHRMITLASTHRPTLKTEAVVTAKELKSCGCYLGFFGFGLTFWKSYFKVKQARFKRTSPAQGLFNSQERQSWQ